MRARRPAHIADDLERYSRAIVQSPRKHRGKWAIFHGKSWKEVRVDLGCGKGAFLVASAIAEPEVLFLGVDSNETCIARCAQKIVESRVDNAAAVLIDADNMEEVFAEGEIARIYLNFNSPFPKRKQAHMRLTHLDYLLKYRTILSCDGFLDMRTDNVLYWEFSLGQLELARYRIVDRRDDVHVCPPEGMILVSEYDERTVSRGARVRWLQAAACPFGPGESACTIEQDRPLGLIEYLPEDLEEFDEVPYGMEDTVVNMRNRRRNALRRDGARRKKRAGEGACRD